MGHDEDDAALSRAVATSTSWRGVLRALGRASASSTAIAAVRRRSEALDLDVSHLTGRRWTEDQLAEAVRASTSWSGVAAALGLAGGSSGASLQAHAHRLGLDCAHLGRPPAAPDQDVALVPDLTRLPRAASMLAAGWFTLCGHDVSWPLEPARYDLVVSLPSGLTRVQVKTTSVRAGATWIVWLSTTRRGRTVYAPEEVDAFFVVDGDLAYYLIPLAVVGGRHAVHLSAYQQYKVKDGDARLTPAPFPDATVSGGASPAPGR